MKVPQSTTGKGALAGVCAATALILWFFVIDLLHGEPFATPSFVSRAMFGGADAGFNGLAIALYTVVHYAVWAAVGVAVAWAVERLEVVPNLLLGVVLGFLLFDIMFYGSVTLTGVDVVGELGWPVVLTGNILAGLVFFQVLDMEADVHSPSFQQLLSQHYIIQEGLVCGLIGAVLVALWFLGADLIAGRPAFYTPSALGSAVFLGARSAEAVQITLPIVLGFSLLHMAGFIVTGLVAAGIFAVAEDTSEAVLLGGVLLFVVFEVFSIGLLAVLMNWLFETLSWWNVLIANLIAALGMGTYLALRHPKLMHDLGHNELEEELADARGDEDPAPHYSHRG